MLNKTTRDKIEKYLSFYEKISAGKKDVLADIADMEVPEMVYNSNAIENSTLTLEDTERILSNDDIKKQLNMREVFEAKNLGKIMNLILKNPNQKLSVQTILDYHKILLEGINDDWAGRFRAGREWVRIGNNLGANPDFVPSLINDLVNNYNSNSKELYFLDNIAYFHAEFEIIHPFCDGNGRMGRVLINQQLLNLGLPPIIVPNKNKHSEYYPLFVKYFSTTKFDGFTEFFVLLLLEAFHKRISYLTAKRIIPLSVWAKQNNVKGNIAANKAKRQTIPAFRLREKWMISETYRENSDVFASFHA